MIATLTLLSTLNTHPFLPRHLVEWAIDPVPNDVTGDNKLHCADMESDLESMRAIP